MKKTNTALAVPIREDKRFPYLLGDIDRQANVAMYYGFSAVKTPTLSGDDIAKAKPFAPKRTAANQGPVWNAEERCAILRTFLENGMNSLPHPVMMYYRKPFSGTGIRRVQREAHCGLEIFGTTKSVGEALVILASYAMLRDDGYENLVVELNSVGERDTMARHERELAAYLKKHANSIPGELRTIFKNNIFDILTSGEPEFSSFRDAAPKSVNFLSEASRRHFMEVLEYLDMLDVPYRINHTLLDPRPFATHTIFEIRDVSDETRPVTLACGSRYTHLTKKFGFKKELPAVGSSILYKRPAVQDEWKPITNPKFYLIQLGNDARLKSVKVIETLRRERIAVYHSLTKDKLVAQMSLAEQLKVPYLLIMGQKEALENSIVVRDLNTRAQETIDLTDLVGYLKKLH